MKDLFLLSQARQIAENATDDAMGVAVRMLIKQFLAMNIADIKPIPQLAVKHFTGENKGTYVLSGICMDADNKVAVGASPYALLVNPAEFKSVAGVKQGTVIVDAENRSKKLDGAFPDYQKLIPAASVTKPIVMRPLQDIQFDAKYAVVDARMNGYDLPVVRVADKTDSQCAVYIAVIRLPLFLRARLDGWEAEMLNEDMLVRPLVKRFEDGKTMLLMVVNP
ncbi:hypothetical protein E5358_12705 [Palleniella muris]|uniref:Uncharacterized protein n=1 Tax=Palleniella muris TaxID=3038145 RepID=A0AC61QMB0_9BACT|nr:hypothetical protein [Palleniella muris]TGX80510.1 hypothetical protein E5358_12705 [Palleniella muris]